MATVSGENPEENLIETDQNEIEQNLIDDIRETDDLDEEFRDGEEDEEGRNEEQEEDWKDENEQEYHEDVPGEAALLFDELSDDKFKEFIEKAYLEYGQLTADNHDLQKKYAAYLASNPSDVREEERPEEEIKPQFYDALRKIEALRQEYDSVDEDAQFVVEDATRRLKEAQEELREAADAFDKFKRTVAQGSRFKTTGKPIDDNKIEEMMERDRQKDEEIQIKRLRNTTLQTTLSKFEEQHKKVDDAKTQRHQIDFEQLKIENQTFNEKIEERTEELQKLRKKINMTVHVLSHFTEKLEFLHSANSELKERLAELERETTRKRDALANIKLERDHLKVDNQRLRQENGLVGNEELLRDFKERRKKQNTLKKKLVGLQHKYELVTGENVAGFSEKLLKAAQEGNKVQLGDEEEEGGEGDDDDIEGEMIEELIEGQKGEKEDGMEQTASSTLRSSAAPSSSNDDNSKRE
ncbi:putative Coiled-coil domain-containing protein 96 [Monocercomonoides exilis]|uniref:putative Coiled-coil domain-containing protein 96 n=1 Tax=Monocercomonoides exilis TaxID=2049356 RepID=UPI00355A881D|nr:putative Coiled-coil domain-containing protein 96 [Monocercomonoides exilis]|eukprot:MONOS_2170.1-p1 / transcript=MONOS_2170.1 / gene=MONOS_2170 / organism=Monocercomonoides_exilis_PA203 / gene_product=Coiled-coil domain-containing protein 96 / transcript_product=Coiled-coil domain-containing protein 96 / location=Mono_scaffold00043:36220-38091(+) / protein_length=467 / sequence_SO=supercontig / SO=protein_coding / is_pseudo=false